MFGWLEHRTGIQKVISLMLLEGVPGGARWRYVWGSCLAFVFSIQLVTGILLMTAYSPSASQAWSSVHAIQYKMDFGWLIRGLHHFGSQTMMVLIALHMLQVVIAGAHLPPRELNWWTGIGLLSVTFGLSLTGYLLPWDQKGYWATDVATNIAGTLPQIGAEVKQQAVGGPDSGNSTLTRFYALHVAVLPLSLIGLLVAHLFVFRRHGVTCKENEHGLVDNPENEHKPGTECFWPRQAFYDMIACMAVFAIMLTLVMYGFAHKVKRPDRPDGQEPTLYEKWARAGCDGKGAELDAAADRDTAGYPARPEWYFLFLFQLLKYFPGDYAIYGTVVIPNGVMVILVLLPLLGIGPLRKFGHLVSILYVVALLSVVGLLTLKALDDDRPEGILGGILKSKSEDEEAQKAVQKAKDFQHKVHEAEILAQRACQLAMDGSPVDGGHFLIRNDPLVAGQTLFQNRCGGCHNFTAQESDKIPGTDKYRFESWTKGEKAGDLGLFGSKEWVAGVIRHSLDDKYFGLVKIPEKDAEGNVVRDKKGNVQYVPLKDDQGNVVKDKNGNPKLAPALDGMYNWRLAVEAQRKEDMMNEAEIAKQEKDFDKIAEWLSEQRKPREERDANIVFGGGQEAFFKGAHKCSGCHKVEKAEKADGKAIKYSRAGGSTGPDLSNYGSADWIRGMIMNPGHKTRYKTNYMPAFRNLDGPGSEISVQELQDTAKGTEVQHLPDIERELIIRWILRDYRPVFGGAPIAK